MRMIRWMCGVKVTDRFTCNELRKRLGTDDKITVLQRNWLRWYGQKWLGEKCMDEKVEAVRPGDQPKKTRTQITEKDCRMQKIN